MLIFAAAVFFLIITPGPGVMTTAGFGAAYGFRPALKYVVGLFIGTNLVMLAVMSGLAAIVLSVPWLRLLLTVASLGYLLFLATRIAFAGAKVAFMVAQGVPGVWAGVTLQAINPKAYAVNSSLILGFDYAPDALLFEMVSKALIMNSIWIPIHLAWLWAGASLHRLNLTAATQRRINVLMALSMLGVVALALWQTSRSPA